MLSDHDAGFRDEKLQATRAIIANKAKYRRTYIGSNGPNVHRANQCQASVYYLAGKSLRAKCHRTDGLKIRIGLTLSSRSLPARSRRSSLSLAHDAFPGGLQYRRRVRHAVCVIAVRQPHDRVPMSLTVVRPCVVDAEDRNVCRAHRYTL